MDAADSGNQQQTDSLYRVVIADDEDAIREGLLNVVDWNSLGFQVVADFRDGEECIDYVSRHPVDVILTDIRMNLVSGLDVAEYVYTKNLGCKVVLLSGYKEFEYARKAIVFDVAQYLLKPVELEMVYSVFNKLKEELDSETILRNQQKKIGKAKLHIQKQLLMDILSGENSSVSEHIGRLCLLDHRLDPSNSPCSVIVFRVRRGVNRNTGQIKEKIDLERQNSTEFYTVLSKYELLVCFAISEAGTAEQETLGDIETFFFKLKKSIRSLYGAETEYEIRCSFPSLNELDGIKMKCSLEGIVNAVTREKVQYQEHMINQAKTFIQENYAKDLSLEEAAESVFLSPVYFSRLFKEVTGKSFIKYLTSLRISKAIELLENTHYRANEIGEMVGYKTISYFSKIFKKYTGMTPSKYRNSYHETNR
jgi:two-component system, response regulator YesN